MKSSAPLLCLALALLVSGAGPVAADETGDTVTWIRTLSDAFAAAKEQDRPLMICINSEVVDGGRREPAAKELREKTYKDPSIVTLSRQFVCAFLTAEGSSEDFGELRLRFGIDGEIVSPQHIFAYPDGTLITRKEYWPYGRGQGSVSALKDLMQKALSADRSRRGLPDSTPPEDGEPADGADDPPVGDEVPEAPEDAEARATWILEQRKRVLEGDPLGRQTALKALVLADQGGDTLAFLIELLDEWKKDALRLVDVVRVLGRPGLDDAAKPLTKLLGHKDDSIRANTAVSLEYIGCDDAVSSLMKYAKREDDTAIANHMYRALGRCGVGQAKVRSFLVKMVQGGKSNSASYGPIIGLAYFEQDSKTAREVEKLMKKEGIPGGRRGGWRGGTKRALLTWCLTEVGFNDRKSAKFMREDFIPIVAANAYAAEFVDFFVAAAECCEGNAEAKDDVNTGVRWALGRARTGRAALMDDARRDRDDTGFEPKADDLMGGGGG